MMMMMMTTMKMITMMIIMVSMHNDFDIHRRCTYIHDSFFGKMRCLFRFLKNIVYKMSIHTLLQIENIRFAMMIVWFDFGSHEIFVKSKKN